MPIVKKRTHTTNLSEKKGPISKQPGKLGKPGNRGASPVSPIKRSGNVELKIIDAFKAQDDTRYVVIGYDQERSAQVRIDELLGSSQKAFSKLMANCIPSLQSSSQNKIKALVESHTKFRPALVATEPGWLRNCYVMGDGQIIRSKDDETEVLVSFEAIPKFIPVGTLKAWQASLAPFVAGQDLCLFALALGFVGYILPFAPSDYLNPVVEFVGPSQSGKSTLAALSASISSGDRENSCGGAESWNCTPAAIPGMGMKHRHNLLVLDEANLTSNKNLSEVFFNLAQLKEKQRFGEPRAAKPIKLGLLSTSNESIEKRVNARAENMQAVLSRVVTVEVDKESGLGIFSYEHENMTTRQMAEGIHAAINRNYGVAGRAFVKKLVERLADQSRGDFRETVSKRLNNYMQKSDDLESDPRIQKTLALIAVAGDYAQWMGIIPKEWGKVSDVVLRVHERVAATECGRRPQPAIEMIYEYHEANKNELLNLSTCIGDVGKAFLGSPGCLHSSHGREAC